MPKIHIKNRTHQININALAFRFHNIRLAWLKDKSRRKMRLFSLLFLKIYWDINIFESKWKHDDKYVCLRVFGSLFAIPSTTQEAATLSIFKEIFRALLFHDMFLLRVHLFQPSWFEWHWLVVALAKIYFTCWFNNKNASLGSVSPPARYFTLLWIRWETKNWKKWKWFVGTSKRNVCAVIFIVSLM